MCSVSLFSIGNLCCLLIFNKFMKKHLLPVTVSESKCRNLPTSTKQCNKRRRALIPVTSAVIHPRVLFSLINIGHFCFVIYYLTEKCSVDIKMFFRQKFTPMSVTHIWAASANWISSFDLAAELNLIRNWLQWPMSINI